MDCAATTILVACVAIGFSGCGARTGFDDFDVDVTEAGDVGEAAAQSPASDMYCAFHLGPVASPDVPPEDGPVTKCAPGVCADIGGQWLCCYGPGPHYNGASGDCAVPNCIAPGECIGR
jgi:hypothetical protein